MKPRAEVKIWTTVNDVEYTTTIPARLTVAEYLRDELGLTGTKTSCEMEVCGVCSVLIDGLPVSSCTALAVDLDGKRVTTVEGLADGNDLSLLQEAFIEKFALQCGFCTPGFLIMGTALLDANPNPTQDDVVDYLDGNICRCTGYRPIVDAILITAKRIRDARD